MKTKSPPLAHRCRLETLEDRRMLSITLNNLGRAEWTGHPVQLAPEAVVSGTLNGIEVWIMQGLVAHSVNSVLDAEVPAGIAKSWDNENKRLSLTGTASAVDYQDVMRSVTYHNTDPLRDGVRQDVIAVSGSNIYTSITTPVLSIDDVTATKSTVPSDPVDTEFTIALDLGSGLLRSPASVHWATHEGSALAGIDFIASSGDVTFQPGGPMTQTVSVPVMRVPADDSLAVQRDKTFTIVLSNPQNALLTTYGETTWITGDDEGIGTISDGRLTNPLPDSLATISLSAITAEAQAAQSLVTGAATIIVPTITGPLAEQAAVVHMTNSGTPYTLRHVLGFDAAIPEGPGSIAYNVILFPHIGNTLLSVNPAPNIPGGNMVGGMESGELFSIDVISGGGIAFSTGTYLWEVTASYSFAPPFTSPPSPPVERVYHGLHSFVNRRSSPYGDGMWINGLDQLFIEEEDVFDGDFILKPQGVTYVSGDGEAIFFAQHHTTEDLITPRGYFLTLEHEGDGYALSDARGVTKHFTEGGLLESLSEPNGNEITYLYNSDQTIASITDSWGHAVIFDYASGGKLSAITDARGRVTLVDISGGRLVSISAPPNDPGGERLVTELGLEHIKYPSGERVLFNGSYSLSKGSGGFTSEVKWHVGVLAVEPTATAVIRTNGASASVGFDSQGWVSEYTDFNGHTTKYERDDNGLILSITLPGEDEPQYTFTYDDDGNLLTRTSRGTPGIGGLPDAIETWTYDSTWNVPNSYTDPYDNFTSYDIDPANGQVRAVTQTVVSALGEPNVTLVTQFSYTSGSSAIPAGLLASTIDANQVETRYDYEVDGDQFIQTVIEAYGTAATIERKYVYDFDTMNLVEVVNERSLATSYEYDDLDRITRVREPSWDGQEPGAEWEYRYDVSTGVLNEAEDPCNMITKYSASYASYIYRTVTYPKASPNDIEAPVVSYTYGPMDRLRWLGEPQNLYTHYEYDPNGNVNEVQLPDVDGVHPTWTYSYNALNLLEWEQDPEGNRTDYVYDNRGQLKKVIAPPDPSGARPETEYLYDNRGLLVGVQDPMGRLTTYAYDSIGRLEMVAEPYPGGGQPQSITTYRYDKVGNLRFKTVGAYTPLAQTTEYVYDELYRLREVREPEPTTGAGHPTTFYSYYATGELHTLTDPNQNVTTWNIDNLGRVTEEIDPLGHSKYFQYDAIGNLTQVIDRNGRVTSYDYDALNRMTTETWYADLGSLDTPLRALSYGYDLAGNLTSASDPAASYTFVPDNLGRVQSTTVNLPNIDPVILVNHYDQNNNRTQLAAQIGGTYDFNNTYAYDNLNRLTSVIQDAASLGNGNEVAFKQVGFGYNAAGQVTNVNRFNAFTPDPNNYTGAVVRTTQGYDGAGRLTNIVHRPSGEAQNIQVWTYDVLNRVATYNNSRDSPTPHVYQYDATNQLISDTNGPDNTHTYDYDLAGNRELTDSVVSTPGMGNRLLWAGPLEYVYDDEGNLAARKNWDTGQLLIFEWDHRNRLVSVGEWKEGQLISVANVVYEYDVFNRRVARTERINHFADGAEGEELIGTDLVAEKFIYDSDDIIFDFQSSDEETYELARRYLHGPAVDEILAQENVLEDLEAANRVYWLLGDNQGTIRDLIDNTGHLAQHYNYTGFGQLVSGDTTLTRYLYTGRELDSFTGLQYNRMRWYDPATGRFLSPDPIGFAGGDSNLYRYVGNSVTNATDPSGLWSEPLNINEGQSWSDHFYWDVLRPIAELPTAYWKTAESGEQARSLAAGVDGFIPFFDPFEYAGTYNRAEGVNATSQTVGALTRDAMLVALAVYSGGFSLWLRNPFLYEVGSTTVPATVWAEVQGLSVLERGAWLWARYGWRVFMPSSAAVGQFGTTIWTGGTPGAWLSLLAFFEGGDAFIEWMWPPSEPRGQ